MARPDWLYDKAEAYEKKSDDGIIARRQHGLGSRNVLLYAKEADEQFLKIEEDEAAKIKSRSLSLTSG